MAVDLRIITTENRYLSAQIYNKTRFDIAMLINWNLIWWPGYDCSLHKTSCKLIRFCFPLLVTVYVDLI